jgi:hypothetical protein
VEETKDPSGHFYQKKVVKTGPGGFQSVQIMTQSSGNVHIEIGGGGGASISSGGPGGILEEMSRIMGMFQQMAQA